MYFNEKGMNQTMKNILIQEVGFGEKFPDIQLTHFNYRENTSYS